ncbi:MAG TPA: methyltransferase domain-containing protein [Thermoleophilaceae bacterium]
MAALRAGGVPVSTLSVDVPLPELDGPDPRTVAAFEELQSPREPDVNLICVNAPELPEFALDVGRPFFEGRRSIGVWAWETDEVPEEWDWAFGFLDEIWTYSEYVAGILRQRSPLPVVRVPLPVLAPQDPPPPAPDLGLPDRFTFLFLFDFYSTLQRKNPLGLVEAFKRAFRPGEGPQLLLKSFNGDYKKARRERLVEAASDHPDIHVVDRYLSAAEKDGLIAASDCYVSLHRSEGFGLTLAEAMARGKPVIGTGFSGNTDFMTADNSYLVRHRMTRVGSEGENYPEKGSWAEPDLDHAAALMREVWEDREGAADRAARGRRDVLEKLSVERVGSLARERVSAVAAKPVRAHPDPPPALEAWFPLRMAKWKVGFDPLAEARKHGGPKGFARAAALRAMRPHTYHQEQLNLALLQGLHQLADRLDRMVWDNSLQGSSTAHLARLLQAAQVRPSPTHPAISFRDESGTQALGFDRRDEPTGAEEAYLEFESVFRGDEALVQARQETYLELLRSAPWVLDVGCGRGEFLDLLREHGIEGRGVDLDQGMTRRAQSKGHDVERTDALEYLAGFEDGSVPAIFAAQFVEHLSAEELVRFLRLAGEKTSPGGTAIFETVNPHSPAAMKAFWVDPTHHHPLFPEVLLAHCRFAGFDSGRVVFPNASGDFEADVYDSPDYAVVATARG